MLSQRLIQSGPRTTQGVMLVGEAPGADEDAAGIPFVGYSGKELDSELTAAGWSRAGIFITNVCHERPPGNDIEKFFAKKSEAKHTRECGTDLAIALATLSDLPLARLAGRYPRRPILHGLGQLQKDIDALQPRLIIAMGNTALWALTGNIGIRAWRGSILEASGGPVDGHGIKLIPTVHTASVLREYQWRAVVVQDLKRAKREAAFPEIRKPSWHFTVPETIPQLEDWLTENVASLPADYPIGADVENDYETERVHDARIFCVGLGVSSDTACCVPMVHRSGSNPHWWRTASDERDAVFLLKDALQKRPVIFHNGLHDCQVIARNWGFLPRFAHDTMVAQHVLFPAQLGGKIDPITGKVSKNGSSYSLLFCSSMYCKYHRYWKDDGKGWDASIHDEMQYWRYNMEDIVRMYECHVALQRMLTNNNLMEQYLFLMSLFDEVFEMMFDGCAFDNRERMRQRFLVKKQIREIQAWIDAAVGHPLNVRSKGPNGQMHRLFYNDFQLTPIMHRKTKKPTLDDSALEILKKRNYALRPLIERIQAILSLHVFKENFLDMRLTKADQRLRSAINVAGPETYRFSMNSTALGEGGNLQNLPRMED